MIRPLELHLRPAARGAPLGAAAVLLALSGLLVSPPISAAPPATSTPPPPLPKGADPPAAAATGSEPTDAARKDAASHYERGLKLYGEGEMALAAIEFDRAYKLVPDYRVLFNIGQVRLQLGQYAEARPALERYLREGGDRVPAVRLASVKSDLETVATRTATVRIVTNVAGAEILVDNDVVATSPISDPLLLNAGEHRIGARKEGYQPKVVRQALAGRDDITIKLDLDPAPEQPRVQLITAPLAPMVESTRPMWRWVTWTGAGALSVGAAVTGGLGIKAAHDLRTMQQTVPTTSGALTSQSQDARGLLLAADILGGTAIATAGVAIYLTITPGSAEKAAPGAPRLGLTLGPTWVGLSGNY